MGTRGALPPLLWNQLVEGCPTGGSAALKLQTAPQPLRSAYLLFGTDGVC